jgi:hypothetical protein
MQAMLSVNQSAVSSNLYRIAIVFELSARHSICQLVDISLIDRPIVSIGLQCVLRIFRAHRPSLYPRHFILQLIVS